MTQLRTALLVLAVLTMGASANRIQPWLGTWSCKTAGNNHTATFSPLFGGKAMRISETGSVPSEELIAFDGKQQRWIDQYRDASGTYMDFVGTPSANKINFAQVYPSGDASILVTMASKNVYTTIFSATMNGKKMVEHETCTRTSQM